MMLSSGRSTTLVASSRPPSPTSSKSASAGCSAKAMNAAAVVISKKVMCSPALIRCASRKRRDEFVLADRTRLAVRTGELDALVKAHEVRRGVDVHALAGGLQHRLQEGDRRALAVGARDMDDRRQALLADVPSLASSPSMRPSDRSIRRGCSVFISASTWSLVGMELRSRWDVTGGAEETCG